MIDIIYLILLNLRSSFNLVSGKLISAIHDVHELAHYVLLGLGPHPTYRGRTSDAVVDPVPGIGFVPSSLFSPACFLRFLHYGVIGPDLFRS